MEKNRLLIENSSDLGDQFTKWEFEGNADEMANIISELMVHHPEIGKLFIGSVLIYCVKNNLPFDDLIEIINS